MFVLRLRIKEWKAPDYNKTNKMYPIYEAVDFINESEISYIDQMPNFKNPDEVTYQIYLKDKKQNSVDKFFIDKFDFNRLTGRK